jgi:hypothetical protein
MSGFRAKFRLSRHSNDQFTEDGRNLSDTNHPDYDPATDPELREYSLPIKLSGKMGVVKCSGEGKGSRSASLSQLSEEKNALEGRGAVQEDSNSWMATPKAHTMDGPGVPR